MVHYYPGNARDHVDYQRHLRAKQQQQPQHYRTASRRRSISKSYNNSNNNSNFRQQPPPPPPPPPPSPPISQQYPWPYYFEDEQDIYELPLSYWQSHEAMPDDLMDDDDDDDYYMDYAAPPPGPSPWSFSTRLAAPPPLQRRRSLASHQPDYYYYYDDDNDKDDDYLANEDKRIISRRQSKMYHDGRYVDSRRRRSLGPPPQKQPAWDSDYGDYSNEEEEQDDGYARSGHHQQYHQQPCRRPSMQQQQHYRRHQHRTTTPWIHSPIMGSPESTTSSPVPHHQPSLRNARMEQALSIDTQQQLLPPSSFYGQVHPPSILPMPQPMMPPPPAPPSFLPHHLNYTFPTIPNIMPPAPPPFNPMMMPQSHYHLPDTTTTATTSSPAIAPAPPSSDDAKSPSSAPDLTTTTSPVSSATTTVGENALVPLARSLSLGTSQPLRTNKPRRRSLFGSLFGPPVEKQQQLSSSSSSTSSPSLIPVHELTKDSLTRKQSISLEKKAKALSQRSYIWCYRIKPSLTYRTGEDGGAWIAMVPKNQAKLDPYLCFYQPNAFVKGLIRTENLPTLLTLDKEPKLTGSITVMPQAKIARVYPSMFSSSNYIELVIDCLPADSQFVVRSD